MTKYSPREKQIIRRIIAGMPQTEIAAELGIAPATVSQHIQRAMVKVDALSLGQLCVIYDRETGSRRAST